MNNRMLMRIAKSLWPLVLWFSIAITVLIPPGAFAYDGQNQTKVAYDRTGESAVGYDADSVFAIRKNQNRTIEGGIPFAIFREFVAAESAGTGLASLTSAEARQIQAFADRFSSEVNVVGSRAAGTAGPFSDFDYVIGGNARLRHSAEYFLPRNPQSVMGTEAGTRARNTVGPGSGGAYGTRVHSAFETEVGALGNANLSSEVSYLNGQVVTRGTPGSVRLDVVNGPLNAPVSIFDLKTGSATLTPARIQQIQSHIPGGANVPVFQVRP